MLIDRYLPTFDVTHGAVQRGRGMKPRSEVWLTTLIVVLAIPVHLTGLLVPGFYRDPVVLLPQNLGTDLVTLCIGIPLLAVSAIAMQRGSLRSRLLWLGALGYLVYAYGMYALGVRWNPLFLAYLALFGLSVFTLTIGVVGTDAALLCERAKRARRCGPSPGT
jgi:hypothetical protein